MKTRITLSLSDGVATLTLSPAVAGKPPTLDLSVLDELEKALAGLEGAPPRLLVARSSEAKYFCVGADVGALRGLDHSTIDDWITRGHGVFARLEGFPAPTVAWVEGYALGGGLELALACDFIFASASAQFGQTESRLGFVAGWGGTWRLPRRLGLARAKELSFTGRIVPAAEAKTIGLADVCGTPAEVEVEVQRLAASVREGSAVSIREFKRRINASPGLSREEAARGEIDSSRLCVSDPDTQARVARFLHRKR